MNPLPKKKCSTIGHPQASYLALKVVFIGEIAYLSPVNGPQMALAYRLDAISQGPKKSQFPGPNLLPLALVMDAARIKSITHRAV
jgi:hypothetical protein